MKYTSKLGPGKAPARRTLPRIVVSLLVVCLAPACKTLVTEVDATACASERKWTGSETGDPRMEPGRDCISCHADKDGPKFTAAGTVYGGLGAASNCFGLKGATIELTDANQVVHSLTSNSAGNFYLEASLATPYTAAIIYDGVRREMETPQVSGACNTCHTQTGASDATGRIVPSQFYGSALDDM